MSPDGTRGLASTVEPTMQLNSSKQFFQNAPIECSNHVFVTNFRRTDFIEPEIESIEWGP